MINVRFFISYYCGLSKIWKELNSEKYLWHFIPFDIQFHNSTFTVDENLKSTSATYHRGPDWVVCVVGDNLSSGSVAWILECGARLGMYQHQSTADSTQMSRMKGHVFLLWVTREKGNTRLILMITTIMHLKCSQIKSIQRCLCIKH